MEAMKESMSELMNLFNSKMSDIQLDLNKATATSTVSSIASDFASFKTFICTALKNLQYQVELLNCQFDEQEMRTRRKFFLLHGLPESKREDASVSVTKFVNDHFKTVNFTSNDISRCQRLGRVIDGKPRPLLIKFKDIKVRDEIWFTKTVLKNSGLTLSEFLTKRRHDVFLAARQQFGVGKCWTRAGVVFVISSDGSKHRVTSLAEVKKVAVSAKASIINEPTATVSKSSEETAQSRSKRTGKNK